MTYLNIKKHGEVETFDEFDNYKEAREMLKEYRLNSWYSEAYLSSRSTSTWRKR